MPSDAMKGLQAALRDREEHHSRVERRILSDETIAANSAVLARIDVGSRVRLRYYGSFHETVRSGAVEELSMTFRFLRLGEEKIYFDDIYEISDAPQ